MSDTTSSGMPFSREKLEEMNSKTIQNQFFTPDHVYFDLSLMKDIPLGIVYADTIRKGDEAAFANIQQDVLKIVVEYQKRRYETSEEYLGPLGYNDKRLDELLKSDLSHDGIFLVSPTTSFFDLLIRHTVRNQNNSGPAKRFSERRIDAKRYVLEPDQITYYINTYPLLLSNTVMESVGQELGESFGVNIKFINKDPALFDRLDWDQWINRIDCFYLNSLGRFLKSPYMHKKQGELQFAGTYFFVRKRFETEVKRIVPPESFDLQIQQLTARIDVMCDFAWLQNNDTRLTHEAEHIVFDEEEKEDAS